MIRCATATLSLTMLLALLGACSNASDTSYSPPPQANEQVAVDAGSLRLVITASP